MGTIGARPQVPPVPELTTGSVFPMFDDSRMLDLIERSIDADPTCSVCGAPTDVRDHDGRLWLECSSASTEPPSGLLARLEAAILLHPRRLIVDLREPRAA
jgi:hypothetical protein